VNEMRRIVAEGFDAPTVVILGLGVGLVVTGLISLRKGRTWIKLYGGWGNMTTLSRSEEPITFWSVVILLYLGFGAVLIFVSVIGVLVNVGYVTPPLFK
jgi:hypothetical protein